MACHGEMGMFATAGIVKRLFLIEKKLSFGFLFLLSVMLMHGCSSIHVYHPLPRDLESQVSVPGFKDIRAWGDVHSDSLSKSAVESIVQEKAANHGKLQPVAHALALSGGGPDGAFGAGLLYGWSKTGKRPEFKLVSGISTGALIAPFAFLGPRYDERLKTVYTTMSDKTIYSPYSMFSILLSFMHVSPLPSLADNKALAHSIAQQVDERMLQDIAREHRKGRRLIVGSTQLNAQRMVIWNMGAIAASGSPYALQLFRKVLLASASLPVTFPPQYFTVEAAGKTFTEMHVDGGLEAQVMIYENALAPFSRISGLPEGARRRTIYIVRNQKISAEWQHVQPLLTKIAIRSIDSLTKSQGIGDLFRLYLYSERDKMEYHLAYIPHTFTETPKTAFDNAYMKKLFAVGEKLGEKGYSWHRYPPEYEPSGEKVTV